MSDKFSSQPDDVDAIMHAIDHGDAQVYNLPGVIESLDAAGFVIVRKGLHQSLRRMVEAFIPFTIAPIGAPGSEARDQQDEQIEAHAEAKALAYPSGHLRKVW